MMIDYFQQYNLIRDDVHDGERTPRAIDQSICYSKLVIWHIVIAVIVIIIIVVVHIYPKRDFLSFTEFPSGVSEANLHFFHHTATFVISCHVFAFACFERTMSHYKCT